jgi:hypothetical protein
MYQRKTMRHAWLAAKHSRGRGYRYRLSLALAALLAAPALVVAAQQQPALADAPTACHNDTTFARTYTHGSPKTGLPTRHGYYYLDVKFGQGCGVGADGLVHLYATLRPLTVVGPHTSNDPDGGMMYWTEFHYNTSAEVDLNNSRYVTTTGEKMPCSPGSKTVLTCTCIDGLGTIMVMRYDGPDIFGLSKGKDARFRIANESGEVLTDFASIRVVKSSTATS